MLTILLFAVHSAFATAPAAPPPPPPTPPESEEHGGGGRGGHGHDDQDDGGERLMKHFAKISKKLGLSAEQKTAVEKLYYDSKSTGIDLQAKSDKGRLEMERLMMGDTVDEKVVMKSFDAAAAAETEVRRNDLKLMLGLRKILTAEQWTQLKEMRDSGREGKRERHEGREEHEGHGEHEDDDDDGK